MRQAVRLVLRAFFVDSMASLTLLTALIAGLTLSLATVSNTASVAIGFAIVAVAIVTIWLQTRHALPRLRDEQELFERVAAIFNPLSDADKAELEKFVPGMTMPGNETLSRLETTGLVVRDGIHGRYWLAPAYASMIRRLTKEWRAGVSASVAPPPADDIADQRRRS